MDDDGHKSVIERVKETASELFSSGPEGERDGSSLIDEGTEIGSGFGTYGTGAWPGGEDAPEHDPPSPESGTDNR
jgi:hypothetical protein